MPYVLRANNDGTYAVLNSESGKVHAKHSTKKDAKAQIRLLNAIHFGFEPTGKPARESEKESRTAKDSKRY